MKNRRARFFETKENGQEKVALDTVYLRVIPVLMYKVYEEEVLLDSRSQIIFMSRAIAAISKITWDLSLSIQMQSTNKSLS